MTGREAGAGGPGGPARSPADLAKQLRDAADRLMSGWSATGRAVTGAASHPGVPPALPNLPAASSAQQVEAVLDDIAAHRARVQALQTQLGAFGEQLGLLEANLRPVLEWTRAWAHVEKAMSEFWGSGAPAAGDPERRSPPADKAE